jgi:hypothetical protein
MAGEAPLNPYQGKSKVRWQCHSEERSDEESLRLSPSTRETLRYAQGDIASSIRKNATFDKPCTHMPGLSGGVNIEPAYLTWRRKAHPHAAGFRID